MIETGRSALVVRLRFRNLPAPRCSLMQKYLDAPFCKMQSHCESQPRKYSPATLFCFAIVCVCELHCGLISQLHDLVIHSSGVYMQSASDPNQIVCSRVRLRDFSPFKQRSQLSMHHREKRALVKSSVQCPKKPIDQILRMKSARRFTKGAHPSGLHRLRPITIVMDSSMKIAV